MATATTTTTAQAASKSTTTTTTTPTMTAAMARDAEEEHQLLSDEASSTFSADAETEQLDMLRSKWDTPDTLDDSVLRYSFKGSPPEEYSPKKEYIYTQPLVKQEVCYTHLIPSPSSAGIFLRGGGETLRLVFHGVISLWV